MENKEFHRFTLDLPKSLHKRLKTTSALYNKTMSAIVVEALNLFYKEQQEHSNVPNAETAQVLDEIARGEGLIECKNLEDLFNKLGI